MNLGSGAVNVDVGSTATTGVMMAVRGGWAGKVAVNTCGAKK
jgi:hypothetical protein